MSMPDHISGLQWFWQRISDVEISDELIQHIQSIFRDGFSRSRDWHETKIRRRLDDASVIGLLEVPDAPPAGYAIYSSPDQTLDGKFVPWEDGVCIRRTLQGQGKSPSPRQLLRELGKILGREIGWFEGDTQNPVVYTRYASLGRVFPIDIPFTSAPGQRLLNFLLESVPQV
jgi:hypothetical protein